MNQKQIASWLSTIALVAALWFAFKAFYPAMPVSAWESATLCAVLSVACALWTPPAAKPGK